MQPVLDGAQIQVGILAVAGVLLTYVPTEAAAVHLGNCVYAAAIIQHTTDVVSLWATAMTAVRCVFVATAE